MSVSFKIKYFLKLNNHGVYRGTFMVRISCFNFLSSSWEAYIYIYYVCVCMYTHTHIYMHTYTHTPPVPSFENFNGFNPYMTFVARQASVWASVHS